MNGGNFKVDNFASDMFVNPLSEPLCVVGAVALAEFIADSARLLRIDLRENDIKTAGLMALSLSFKVSPTLTRLDLDKEPKKESVSRLVIYPVYIII